MESNNEMTNIEKTPRVTVFQNALKYGLYTAVAYIVVSLLFYVLDVDRESWLNYLTFLVLLAGIVMGTLNYRDKINGGSISFGQAFLTGFLISLLVGIVGAIYIVVFFNYIDPTAAEQMMEAAEAKMVERGLSDEMIDKQLEMSKKFMTPGVMSAMGVFFTTLFGSIMALITSAILKKTDDSFNATFQE